MPQTIDVFLRAMRRNFPTVYLTNTEGEGAAIKRDWGNDMAQYDPKIAGHLKLNRTIINNMIYAFQQREISGDNYNLFKYQMGITVAHEIVHFLTGYLTGTARPNTPPGVSLTLYGSRINGEAGRYWESTLLGGVVEFYENTQDPLRERQAGIPYLIDDGRNAATARQISMNYINSFLNGTLSFPVCPSSRAQPTTRAALRRTSRETSQLRARRNTLATTSPPRSNPPVDSSSSTAHRKLPAQYFSGVYPEYASRQDQDYRGRGGY